MMIGLVVVIMDADFKVRTLTLSNLRLILSHVYYYSLAFMYLNLSLIHFFRLSFVFDVR